MPYANKGTVNSHVHRNDWLSTLRHETPRACACPSGYMASKNSGSHQHSVKKTTPTHIQPKTIDEKKWLLEKNIKTLKP